MKINDLVILHSQLIAENIMCATLGAAYAAMTRDTWNEQNVSNCNAVILTILHVCGCNINMLYVTCDEL